MALTKVQTSIWQKARALGSGGQAIQLSDEMCAYLIGRIIIDLRLSKDFPEIPKSLPPFFGREPALTLLLPGLRAQELFERLVSTTQDTDTYFACLAALHKARLKYEIILATQPMPTVEQVGPRSLLQYGKLEPKALVGLLFWRKWFFDIDNRAGQETGYLFEPIIAYAIGGVPAPASKSPVRRTADPTKGRQVDCLLGRRAYEIKLRVTIAASGQGRWTEELDFATDCRASKYTPVLICLDSTPNPKLAAIREAFRKAKGEVYVGEAAWRHLDEQAGETMARFLDLYVRAPLQDMLASAEDPPPDLFASSGGREITLRLGEDELRIDRRPAATAEPSHDHAPDDEIDELAP